MAWSEATEQALTAWLAVDTWHRRHPLHDGRFCAFVARVWLDEHQIWDECEVRQRIYAEAVRLHPGSGELAGAVARTRAAEGSTILDFLQHLSERDELELLTQGAQPRPAESR